MELTLLTFLLTLEVFLFLFLIIFIEGNGLYFSRGGVETVFLLRNGEIEERENESRKVKYKCQKPSLGKCTLQLGSIRMHSCYDS